jgi:hypothetical protein
MQLLIDCDILEYCFSTAQEREESFQEAVDKPIKPVYQLPVFELCHAVHLMVKHHQFSPRTFRECWADLSENHLRSGEYFIHVHELSESETLGEIIGMPRDLPGEDNTVPCENTGSYWGHNKHLIYRMRALHKPQTLQNGWVAFPPEGKPEALQIQPVSSQDIVLDTNNLVELLEQLPADGFLTNLAGIHFPSRLSEHASRIFRNIIATYGAERHFIVPMSVLEETQWIVTKPENESRYRNARQVLSSILLDPERPLWRIFIFEPITQEIFEYFLLLYESLEQNRVSFSEIDDFGDMLVLAHALFHNAKIATNEWFEGGPDVWVLISGLFPFLVIGR